MLQSIDNPQPMYIPTRITPDVVASSRQLIPLGIVEQAGKSYYKFDTGCEWYKAIKFYEVDVIRSINQMSETEVTDKTIATFGAKATIEPAKVVAEPVSPTINLGVAEPEAQADAAPGVEPAGSWEVRHIVTGLEQGDRDVDDPKFAAMLNDGWTIVNQQVNSMLITEGRMELSHFIITTFKRYTYRDAVKS